VPDGGTAMVRILKKTALADGAQRCSPKEPVRRAGFAAREPRHLVVLSASENGEWTCPGSTAFPTGSSR
jgi:hypothetical protein